MICSAKWKYDIDYKKRLEMGYNQLGDLDDSMAQIWLKCEPKWTLKFKKILPGCASSRYTIQKFAIQRCTIHL